jgi:hypothetical protein
MFHVKIFAGMYVSNATTQLVNIQLPVSLGILKHSSLQLKNYDDHDGNVIIYDKANPFHHIGLQRLSKSNHFVYVYTHCGCRLYRGLHNF